MNCYESAKPVSIELLQRGQTLAVAESCTGGLIASTATMMAGSSQWFDRGFVTYCNQAKMDMLGVKAETLDKRTAVSKEVAAEMAQGALKNSQADYALAVTGIAGPGGGTKEIPVGTVFVALATGDGEKLIRKLTVGYDRCRLQQCVVKYVYDLLLNYLMN